LKYTKPAHERDMQVSQTHCKPIFSGARQLLWH
jgi:hypothetical protein